MAVETVACWTCGSEVPEDQITTTVGRLQELSQSKLGEVNDVGTRIDELSSKIRELRKQQRKREELQRRIDEAEAEIKTSETIIDRLSEQREELQPEIETLKE